MTRSRDENPYESLDRVFHEPSRLAILSSLVGAGGKATFVDIKNACDLTDGNLSRHLKTLEESGVIRIEKRFVHNRPRTTVRISKRGRTRFLAYLEALEEVLAAAAERISALEGAASSANRGAARVARLRARLAEG